MWISPYARCRCCSSSVTFTSTLSSDFCSGSTKTPEPAHRLLGEGVRVLAECLGGQRLDRGLDPDVEGTTLGRERALGLGQRELRLARIGDGAVAVGERPAQRDEIDACGACDEPDQESDDGHEGDIR